MDQEKLITTYERRARLLGMSIGAVCEEANLHRTTFSRWKRKPVPIGMTVKSINALDDAFARLEAADQISGNNENDTRRAPIALCALCERRTNDPAVNGCTEVDCPHSEQAVA